ncbi:hypothetical protein [Nocardioides mesophilus]|uniref:Uncharacterized protein n=1 Tax=Nocardioides mesophilus TaxID=433659 RepID=A0A7G9RDU3_9ACTN|nr:hypothetical protein [Nocardioides mesophilus]QNN53768.1 hypothetical protein H9L09_04990 [Nocardioides mesophilus]
MAHDLRPFPTHVPGPRRFIHVDPAVSSKDLLVGGLVGGILNAVWAFTVPDESIAWFIAMPLVLLSLGYAIIGLLEVRRSRALEERISARDRPDRSRHHGKPM